VRKSPFRKRRFTRAAVTETLESRHVLATISGHVFNDLDGSGTFDEAESGIAAIQVFVDATSNGTLDVNGANIEPDRYAAQTPLTLVDPNIELSVADATNVTVVGGDVVTAKEDALASTGNHVFGWGTSSSFNDTRRLRIDFLSPVSSVSIDFIGSQPTTGETGLLVAYDSSGNVVFMDETAELLEGEAETLSGSSDSANIAYAVAYANGTNFMTRIDNLRVNAEGSEPWGITDSTGAYSIQGLDDGNHALRVVVPSGWTQTFPADNGANNQTVQNQEDIVDVNFGLRTNRLSGTVFRDVGAVGTYEPGVDMPTAGARVYLDQNGNSQLDRTNGVIEPDGFGERDVLDTATAGVRLSLVDFSSIERQHVLALTDTLSSTGSRVFGHAGGTSWTNNKRLRADFEHGVSSVSLDFIGSSPTTTEQAAIFAYDAAGIEIGADLSGPLEMGQTETLSVQLASPTIAYVVGFSIQLREGGFGRFDNLRFDGLATERAVTSSQSGSYEFAPLADGTYTVRQELAGDQTNSVPAAGSYSAEVTAGQILGDLNFGVAGSTAGGWQNQLNNLDVNGDDTVVPLDALLIINELNEPEFGDPETGELPAPPDPLPAFFDVNGDGFVAPNDAILIINFLNENPQAAAVPMQNSLAAIAETASTPKVATSRSALNDEQVDYILASASLDDDDDTIAWLGARR
jgi:hypothetical protein